MSARDELMLDSMGATPTGFEIKTHAGGPQTAETLLFIADSMRDALDGYDAPNYLEMEVKASDGKRYIMTLQRQGKVTPHQARVKAEEELAAATPRIIEHAHADDGPDELPPLSVVLSGGKPAIKQYDHTFMDWDGSTWDTWELEYPITVLHEPVTS